MAKMQAGGFAGTNAAFTSAASANAALPDYNSALTPPGGTMSPTSFGSSNVVAEARRCGWHLLETVPSRLLGPAGNQEFFALFARQIVLFGREKYRAFLPRTWRALERNLQHPQATGLRAWFDRHVPAEARA